MLDIVQMKKLLPVLVTFISLQLIFPITTLAESLDSLKTEEKKATENTQSITQNINTALTEVNKKYAEVEKLKKNISKSEATLKTLQKEMETTEKNIDRRKKAVGNRMKDVQLSGSQRTWQALLNSENLTDFFNRAYAMSILQNAEKEKVNRLIDERTKLTNLQIESKKTKDQLKANESKAQDEASSMNEQVTDLKDQLAKNQNLLTQIASKKQQEQKKLAEEKIRHDESMKKVAKKTETVKQEVVKKAPIKEEPMKKTPEIEHNKKTVDKEPVQSNAKKETGQPTDQENIKEKPEYNNLPTEHGNNHQIIVQATAYSWRESGASPFSATGIDLRKNPNVIAVDPSIIPLGSLVEVAGYGFAIAGDTGGAIHGNIIDVHFDTVDQCRLWGRKSNVQVTIQ